MLLSVTGTIILSALVMGIAHVLDKWAGGLCWLERRAGLWEQAGSALLCCWITSHPLPQFTPLASRFLGCWPRSALGCEVGGTTAAPPLLRC